MGGEVPLYYRTTFKADQISGQGQNSFDANQIKGQKSFKADQISGQGQNTFKADQIKGQSQDNFKAADQIKGQSQNNFKADQLLGQGQTSTDAPASDERLPSPRGLLAWLRGQN